MTHSTHQNRPDIAVVGISALFPGSQTASGFWRDILAGKDLISDVPETHWLPEDYYDPDPSAPDKTYARRGGFLGDIDFDAMSWGVPPNIIEATDTSQLLALIVAQQVLRDAAGSQFDTMDRSRMSVILGVTSAQELLGTMVSRLQRPIWQKSLREHGLAEDDVQAVCQRISDHYVPWQESSFPGLLGNVVAGRIANRLNLGGTNCVTDAACASTFSALSMAVRELYLGDSDLVITGGVDTLNDIFMFMCFSKTPALSASGDCRPFSDQADGTMLGEGIGMVALKRLEDAERDGDRVYAVIRGVGSSSDGRSKSVYAPVPEGQAKALRRAYDLAGYEPETVELVEAHGTGTKAGDAAEFGGLSMVFDVTKSHKPQWCALGSVKSQIGHTKAAAGAAGLFKTVMALHHKVLPPTIKVDQPNPKLELEHSAFHINTEARPWIRGSNHPRRASVSSFGFGGSNFHITLEEYNGPGKRAARLRTLNSELVVIGGSDAANVAQQARAFAARCEHPIMLRRIAWESQQTFDANAPARLALVATSETELRSKLAHLADLVSADPKTAFEHPDGSAYGIGASKENVAFLFPGQGSQYLGMGQDLAMAFDAARAPWDQSADLKFDSNYDLHQVVHPISRFNAEDKEADQVRLRATEWAQPAIGAASLSLLALLKELGIQPKAVAGHSFGEVTALHAAGLIEQSDFLRIARKRGELMAAASDVSGAMSAVVGSIEDVECVLQKLGRNDVVVANHNASRQVVISGTIEGIEAAEEALKAQSLRIRRLRVSTAFHSPLVSESTVPFAAFLKDIPVHPGVLPAWSGQSASPYPNDATEIRSHLAQQIAERVRFVDVIQSMNDQGIELFLEVGPGNVLTGLANDTLKHRNGQSIALDRRGKNGVAMLLQGLARLSAHGIQMNFAALWQGYDAPEDALARKTPKLAIPLNGSNHGKIYPPKGGAANLPAANTKPSPVPAAPLRMPPTASLRTSGEKTPLPAAGKHIRSELPPASRSTTNATPGKAAPTRPPSAPVPTPIASAKAAPALPTQTAKPPSLYSETMVSNPRKANTQLPHGWLDTWQEAQRQNQAAHAALQDAISHSYGAYLDSMNESLSALATLTNQGALPSQIPQPHPAIVQPSPTTFGNAAFTHAPHTPVTTPEPIAPQAVPHTPVTTPESVHVSPSVQPATLNQSVALPTPQPAAEAPSPAFDLHGLMLQVVAEKTGYPAEMLNLEMDLEGDLGIDSIKRVEILAAVQEQAPNMPEVEATHMATLKTLGEIVQYMNGLLGAQATPTETTGTTSLPSPQPAATAPAFDLHGLMLQVVAEKTGYPAEMLNLEMDLEGDLGIDSIKRVEILAAVQEQAPNMPEVEATHMASLKTLGEIVQYMNGLLGAQATPTQTIGTTSLPSPQPAATAPAFDLHGLMLQVVAEKTGYPAEMLNLEMDLEGDLGIDSIKRVEILAAVQEQAPNMPEVEATHMASLKTLGEIVQYMNGLLGAQATPTQTIGTTSLPTPQPAATAPAFDLHGLMLQVVAEKTGYPAEMLNLEMDLEGDLGIDSIKRVEILAAVQEQAPNMPEVEATHMASLKTLGEIVQYMNGLLGSPTPTIDTTSLAPSAPTQTHASLGRFHFTLAPSPAVGLAQPGLLGVDEVLITRDDSGLSDILVETLAERGICARSVHAEDAKGKAVIFLGGMRHIRDASDGIAVQRSAFQLARHIAPDMSREGGLFITVQDTGGSFASLDCPQARVWLGGLSALTKTAKQEWPKASLKAIDIERGTRTNHELASILADELLLGGADIEVALTASGERLVPQSVKSTVTKGQTRVTNEDVIVVSGGARGVTAACVIRWAAETRAHFVLLGRSALIEEPSACHNVEGDAALKRALLESAKREGRIVTPKDLSREVRRILSSREIRQTLQAIEQAGGQARYRSVDVTNASAVRSVLEETRNDWGRITGLIHGAGVLADRYIAEQTDEQFNRVFDTKVEGLRALLEGLSQDTLSVLCLFSSVAARCGNNGQSTYAMANETLNKVAWAEARSRGNQTLVKSLGWGPWEGGMVSPELRKHFANLGVPMIPLAHGAQMMVDELGGNAQDQVELVLGGEPRPEALLSGTQERSLTLELQLNHETHSYLAGHAIDGKIVVPMVMALEWFSRMARAFRPDLKVASIDDLKVLKGILLSDFRGAGQRFVLSCTELESADGTLLRIDLKSPDGTPHYRANARMVEARTRITTPPPPKPELDAWGNAPVYGDVLFHKGNFQVIEDLDGVSKAGIAGTLKGVHQAQWKWEPWQTDVAALDGGLQMLLLWARDQMGGAALPMGIGKAMVHSETPPEGPVHCVAHCTPSGKSRGLANVSFQDAKGEVFTELQDVELILRPDAASTTTPRNRT